MRVFVAGGTGVVGRRLVPQLVTRGHQVTATTSSPAKLGSLEQLGAEAVVMDALDAVSVGEAVARARPDVIVHQMTAISAPHASRPDMKHMDKWFAATNRLRTEGTDHLTSSTTNPLRPASGCRTSPLARGRSGRCGCPGGWPGCWPGTSR